MIAAYLHRDPSHLLCTLLVVLIIVFLATGALSVLNIVRTHAAWWAWLVAAGIVYVIYYLFC